MRSRFSRKTYGADHKEKRSFFNLAKTRTVTEKIETYTIVYEGKKDYNTSFVHNGNLAVSSITKKEVTNLYPGTHYTFRVSAITACGKGDNSAPSSSTTKVDAPPAPVVGLVGNITAEVNNVTVWKSSNINGQIMTYQIIVLKVDETSSFDKTKLKSYEEAEREKLHYYIAAEIKADGNKKFPRVFILGDEKEYNGYKNVKLRSGTKYQVSQRAMSQNEKKKYLAGESTVIAKGKTPENKGKNFQKTDKSGCIDYSIFAVSLAFNLAFLVFIVLLVMYIIKLRKQLEETKIAENRPSTGSTKDVYENPIASNQEDGLPMTPLPANTGSTYEQIDLHGTIDPSDVQTEVTSHHTTTTDKGSGYYESIPINELNPSKPKPKPKPKPKQQIYETVQPKSQAPNPKQLQTATSSSPQSTYQSLTKENRTKPVYESLHTYGNTKINKAPTQDYDI